MIEATLSLMFIFGIFLFIILIASIRLVNEYERGVVFRLGRVSSRIRQPGIHIIWPIIDRMVKVTMQTVTLPVNSQKIITKDNVSMDVAAVAYYQTSDPVKSLVEIQNVTSAIYQIAQTTVRNVVGQSSLDEVLSQTQAINDKIKLILDNATEKWGIYVSSVELKDIELPASMQRAMAKEAEAEREKRAKIIAAEGEKLSAAALGDAADIISDHPIALQLRNLQVLNEIAVEKNSTIIFPAQMMDSMSDLNKFMAGEMAAKALKSNSRDTRLKL
ncbi:MAG TPA: slipin family protein [Candidatus Saccharibacteria bacterium]|nr:slipin family protein [Candidatus Saccharibacteria bacterium]